jgi:hypothetical protein
VCVIEYDQAQVKDYERKKERKKEIKKEGKFISISFFSFVLSVRFAFNLVYLGK